ncbi:energy-coupling factor transporter transmembrane component T [Prochlorococcus sp. MIT 1223]|uniref:energy-coupling factor transporter transmembrane component T family protein n=1 Tax=Prochlorococcus sp. MIT 1223 TaxID=3096217 RepID=UPI002A7548D7|nr:energy-coupling factor transporter transmembrane component T [Prochlorococcus sp. MIT 1223]
MDWLRKVPIGQYVSGEKGWLRLIDPRMKIVWVLFFLLSPILAPVSWRMGLVLALLFITFVSGLPRRIWIKPLVFLVLLASFIGIFAILLPTGEPSSVIPIRDPQELEVLIPDSPSWQIKIGPLLINRRSAQLGLNSSTLIFTVVHSVNLMLITSTPEDLVWSLNWFLTPLERLGFPSEKISFQMLLALRFIPLIQEEFQNLLRSLSTRAVNFKKLGVKSSFGILLSVGERLLSNILLRSQQGADALVARNGNFLPSKYFRPKRSIVKISGINLFSALAFGVGLILRSQIGN